MKFGTVVVQRLTKGKMVEFCTNTEKNLCETLCPWRQQGPKKLYLEVTRSLILSNHPQRRQGPDPRHLWLLVGTSSAFGPELAYRLRVAQPTLMDVTIYFWYTFILLCMFVYHIFITSPLWLAVGLHKEDYLQIFKYVPFWLHSFCGKWEGWVPVNRFNHTTCMDVVCYLCNWPF